MIKRIKEYRISILICLGVLLLVIFHEIFKGINIDNLNVFVKLIVFVPSILISIGLYLYGRKISYKTVLSRIIKLLSMLSLVILVLAMILQVINGDKTYFEFYHK